MSSPWPRTAAKHQPYRGWTHLRPDLAEHDLFILDELALRKIVDGGRYAYLVVADLPLGRWCVWSTAELVLATKTRTVRTLATGATRQKAKVLLDLTESAAQVTDEHAAAAVVAAMLAACDSQWLAIEPWPHGPAIHNPIPEDVMTRLAAHHLLTIDEARDLVGATAIALVDTVDCQPGRLARLLAGHSTLNRLPGPAARAVRAHRAALRHLHAVGLGWIIDDELNGALSYASADTTQIAEAAA